MARFCTCNHVQLGSRNRGYAIRSLRNRQLEHRLGLREPDGAFSDLAFLNFGKDYQGARDGKEIAARKPIFSDPNGVGWGVSVEYNPGLKRYLLTTFHAWDGSWGSFDAPEPWGLWTTVAYYNQWLDG
jgi:hypothetical protein